MLLLLVFSGCAGEPEQSPPVLPVSPYVQRKEEPPLYLISGYQDEEPGGGIPHWLDRFLAGGTRSLESLAEYRDTYLFVAEGSGNNLNALLQWASDFSLDRDLPRLVALRMESRMTAAVPYPDDEYGPFYETLIKRAFNGTFTGAVREAGFWIRRQFFEDDGLTLDRESYTYFILIGIQKSLLEFQITRMLQEITLPKNRRAQNDAVNRLREDFFNGF
jgi:hypothetical protein